MTTSEQPRQGAASEDRLHAGPQPAAGRAPAQRQGHPRGHRRLRGDRRGVRADQQGHERPGHHARGRGDPIRPRGQPPAPDGRRRKGDPGRVPRLRVRGLPRVLPAGGEPAQASTRARSPSSPATSRSPATSTPNARRGRWRHRRGRAGSTTCTRRCTRPRRRGARSGSPPTPSSGGSPRRWASTWRPGTRPTTTRPRWSGSRRTSPTARRVGVSGTPTFFLNEKKIQPQSEEEFKAAIDAALAG